MITGCFSGQIVWTSLITQKFKCEHLSLNSAFRDQVHVLHLGSLAKTEGRICPGVALKLAFHTAHLGSKQEVSSRMKYFANVL